MLISHSLFEDLLAKSRRPAGPLAHRDGLAMHHLSKQCALACDMLDKKDLLIMIDYAFGLGFDEQTFHVFAHFKLTIYVYT